MQFIEDYPDADATQPVTSQSSTAAGSAPVESPPVIVKSEGKKRRTNNRQQIEHRGFLYYCSDVGRTADWTFYKCKKALVPGSVNWIVIPCGTKVRDLPAGTERCPGRLRVETLDCGTKIYLGGENHLCTLSNVNSYGVPDDRCLVEGCAPGSTWGSAALLDSIRAELEVFEGWHDLTGGGKGTDRVYLPTLGTDHRLRGLFTRVERAMRPYIRWLQERHPKLVHLRYGIIKTLPFGRSQFFLHGNRGHCDFGNEVYRLPPDERPVSMMVALDDFDLIYLPNMSLPDSQMRVLTTLKHNAVKFTNACLHSGGENATAEPKYRIFVYAVSRTVDFPTNHVWISERTHEGQTRAALRALEEPGSVPGFKKPIAVSSRGRTVFEVDRLQGK